MSTPTTTLAALQQPRQPAEATMPAVRAGFFDLQGFELLQRIAKAFASSTLVPVAYQGNVANCMIALNLAQRIGADPLLVMQNLYIVHGSPGWSAKFLIASVNTCGRYESLRYEWRGEPGKDDFGCRAWTIEKATGEKLHGIWVDWKMVKAEGWSKKGGSKWLTMPDQMFVYRAAAFWQRAYAPEISMGLSTAEELADVIDVRTDGSYTVTTESLAAGMNVVPADAAPALEHAPSETLPTSTGRQREAEPIESRAAPAPAPAAERADDAPPPAVDLASVLRNIDAARTEQELEDAGVLIGELPNDAERASAGDAYRERMDALRAPRQQVGRSRAARGPQQSFDAE